MLAIPLALNNLDYTKFITSSANDNIPGAVPVNGEHLHPGIFREYDIRGIVGETFHPQDASHIARAFAAKAGSIQPRIIRIISGEQFYENFPALPCTMMPPVYGNDADGQ